MVGIFVLFVVHGEEGDVVMYQDGWKVIYC